MGYCYSTNSVPNSAPFLLVAPQIVQHFVYTVTGDRALAKKQENRIWDNDCFAGNYSTFFGFRVHNLWFAASLLLSFFLWTLGSIYAGVNNVLMVEVVASVAKSLSPYVGELFLVVGVYFLAIYVGRKLYRLSIKINKVLDSHEAE